MCAYSIIFLLPLSLLIIQLIDLSIEESFAQSYPFIASTRNSYDLYNGKIMQPPNLPSALSILNSNNCPGELAVYVHGVWATDEQAKEQTDRVYLSLINNGYSIPLIGFSWDSNTAENQSGWSIAKLIANENGQQFAEFIKSFKDECANDNIRIIAHSLGSRVTLSAIQSLYESYSAPIVTDLIRSVHLLGAAIDDEQISSDDLSECNVINSPPLKCSGEAVGLVVQNFYNLYNAEDNMLAPQIIPSCLWCSCPFCFTYESSYHSAENDDPLGAYPVKDIVNVPANYYEYSVEDTIELIDDANADGDCDLIYEDLCTIIYKGDNHFGYMGYRSVDNQADVYNTGAIGFVTLDWINENS